MNDFHESQNQADKVFAKRKFENELDSYGLRQLAKLSDEELALYQSGYPDGCPQSILANQEWQRRLIAEQAKTSRLVAFVGIVGTLVGAAAGHLFSKW